MDRSDVVAAFFQPPPSPLPQPAPTVDASAARRFRDAVEPIAMHSVWSERTGAAMEGLGLDFLGAYVGSRAALLGEPDPSVVVAAFAVFEPAMVHTVYEQARSACGRDEILTTRDAATIESLTEALGDVDHAEVADAAQRMRTALDGASGVARPLFSGLAGRPWPDEPVGRLWRACELAREHRGDSHNAVCVAAGLDAVRMNVLTEVWVGMPLGRYSATRGWSEDQITAGADELRSAGLLDGDELTQAGREFRDDVEMSTDALEQKMLGAMGPDVDALIERLDGWSQRCIEHGSFPPDPYKRAAG